MPTRRNDVDGPLRVLYVIDSLAPGGAESSLAMLAPGLIANGVCLVVAPLGGADELAESLRGSGATVLAQPTRHGRLGNTLHVMRVIRRHRPDVVHTTLFEADVAGRVAARVLGVPISSSLVKVPGSSRAENVPSWKLRAANLIARQTGRLVKNWHAVTETVADAAVTALALDRSSIRVIPRGRDEQVFAFRDEGARRDARASLGIDETTKVVLAVARLEYVKGLDRLICAMDSMPANNDLMLLIAGKDGRHGEDVRALARSCSVPVTFLGHREDVPALLAASDVFAAPSRQEGICGALIEALAVGCPALVNDLPTLHDVAGTGADAVAVFTDFDNPASAAQSLHDLLRDEARMDALAQAGRARFEAEFTLSASAEKMTQFLRHAAYH